MPFRVMKQLAYLARGMQCLQDDPSEPLSADMTAGLEWTAYSLANDKRRAFIAAVVALDYQGQKISTRNISAHTGLHNDIVVRGMAQLQALDIISLASEEDTSRREYTIVNRGMCDLVRRLEPTFISQEDIE